MSALPVPDFIERDPAAVSRSLIQQYEELTGRTLLPAQVERLLLEVLAYRETLLRIGVQEAALQNLVAFARWPMLDYLGELVGTYRLPARPAVTTLRVTLTAVQSSGVLLPAGIRVQSRDARAVFATTAPLVIPPGALVGEVSAVAELAGADANGYGAGELEVISALPPAVKEVVSTARSDGGAEIEDDDRYRERIRQAPERFSTAGSAGAYRFHALSVSSSITDVAITNPLMGVVRVHVLTAAGAPSQPLLNQVQAALSADQVRPLSDTVEVVAPVAVSYQITALVRPLRGADVPDVLVRVRAAAEAYAADRRAGLGRDIVPSQIIAALSVSGVYSVSLTLPAERVVAPEEWANCTAISVSAGSVADG